MVYTFVVLHTFQYGFWYSSQRQFRTHASQCCSPRGLKAAAPMLNSLEVSTGTAIEWRTFLKCFFRFSLFKIWKFFCPGVPNI